MAKKTLYESIVAATEISAAAGESAADWTKRACITIGELSDDEYAKLPKEVTSWFDEAVELVNKKAEGAAKLNESPVAGFPVSDTPKAASAPAGKKAPAKATTPAKKAAPAKKAPAAKPDAKKGARASVKAARVAKKKAPAAASKQGTLPGVAKNESGVSARSNSTAYRIRMAVITKPAISFEDAAKKAGVAADIGGHAFNMFNHARIIMGMLAAQDMLK